jgi:hypothetical protein
MLKKIIIKYFVFFLSKRKGVTVVCKCNLQRLTLIVTYGLLNLHKKKICIIDNESSMLKQLNNFYKNS